MRYLLLIYGNENISANASPADHQAMLARWFTYTEDMKKAGAWVAGEALTPTPTATTVRIKNGKTVQTDGPFAETKEQLGGFYMLDVPNLEEATKWAAKCPGAQMGGSIELRPIMDFAQPK